LLGQFVAVEPDGTVVGCASTLIVSRNPGYAEHTWKDITADGLFTTHNPSADSLYGAGIYTHPKHRHEGIGGMLYEARKQLVTNLNLRRMIAGGRLFNYCEYADKISPLEYAHKVIIAYFTEFEPMIVLGPKFMSNMVHKPLAPCQYRLNLMQLPLQKQ
jgi:GNAT superfamily N-acetyltransferase